MKRDRRKLEGKKGYVFPLSDVFEVTFTENARYHASGDKKLVSLPVAIKLINGGKASRTPEIKEAIEKYGMGDMLSTKKGKVDEKI